MCNLYRLAVPLVEVAAFFEATGPSHGANQSSEIYPGYPGAAISDGQLRLMTWGFPLQLKGKQGQRLKPKPVNNARADKLGSSFWRASFAMRRCLIPLTAWAEAEGPKGAKSRTWLNLPDQPIFACAGLWRPSAEWGDVFAMVMTDAAGAAAACHSRMPVILQPADWQTWLSSEPDMARELCVPYRGLIAIDRTRQPWTSSAG